MLAASYATYLVLPCTMLIFAIGYYLGVSRVKHQRQSILQALATVLQTADELSHNVDSHNTELLDMERSVESLDVSTELGDVQQLLLTHISKVIATNRELEDNLVCARYAMERQAQELDRTREEARTDSLSQLGNRKAFDEALQYRLSKWNRQGDRFALVLIDVDHFKWINDTHGHQAGDHVVSGVGELLKSCLEPEDYVARYGGDEFALLLASDDLESAVEVAERIRATAETRDFSAAGNGERVAVTFSMGLAVVRHGDSVETLVNRADAALYEAKRAGRNCLRAETAGECDHDVVETAAT